MDGRPDRLAALLASTFDILFAVDRVPHPGEKRLLDLVERLCPERPVAFCESVPALLSAAAGSSREFPESLSRFLDEFARFLSSTGFSPQERLLNGQTA